MMIRNQYVFSATICLSALLTTVQTRAELEVIEDADGQQGLTVFRMTVTPAAEPVPALKHRFSVPLHKRKPGNAATHYLRSLGESNGPGIRWRRLRDRFGDEVDDWYDLDFPVDEIPMQDFRDAARGFRRYVDNYTRRASECRRCDWGLEEMDLRGPETVAYLLPDAQESRGLSRGLAMLSRLATIDSQYEQAIDYIRMNYQLGQDIAKQRFIVCSLVGLAEVGMANKSVIELISAPSSPNLYWALSELPDPVVDMRESINLEMSFGLRMFPALLDVEDEERAPAEWSRLLALTLDDLRSVVDDLGIGQFPQDKLLAELSVMGMTFVVYPAAKQRLIDSGLAPAKVDKMAVAQVLLLDTAREYQRIAANYEKWWYVAFDQMPRRMGLELEPDRGLSAGFGRILADALLPAVNAAKKAQMRTQWQIAALRAVEAIRMHAAARGGLPASLDDVSVVPVPTNPITKRPFVYRLDGDTAVLELPFSDGMPGVAWRFEIQLAN